MHSLIFNAKLLEEIDVQELQQQIKYNNANAMFNAGMMYYQGIKTKADPEKGIKWLVKAAAHRHKDAAYNLGLIYLLGLGTPCNILKGRDYMELAAKSGRVDLFPLIKVIDDRYRNTKYTDTIFDESLLQPQQEKIDERQGNWRLAPKYMPNWYRVIGFFVMIIGVPMFLGGVIGAVLSAGQEIIPMLIGTAVFLTGIYLFWVRDPGEHFPQAKKKPDFTEADLTSEDAFSEHLAGEDLRDLEYMAGKKDMEAMYKLGFMHQKGIQMPRDLAQAASWYQRAAMLRHPSATYAIGMMYLRGEGVKFNLVKGLDFLEMSASYGNEDAKNIARRIRRAYKDQKLSEVEFEPGLLDPLPMDNVKLTQRTSFKFMALVIGLLLAPQIIMSIFGEFLYHHINFLFKVVHWLMHIKPALILLLVLLGVYLIISKAINKML